VYVLPQHTLTAVLYNDLGHKLRALNFQLKVPLGHLQSLNVLISTAPTAHASFMPLLGGMTQHNPFIRDTASELSVLPTRMSDFDSKGNA